MSTIKHENVPKLRAEMKELGVKITINARPSKSDPSGKRLYFKLEGSRDQEKKARALISKYFPLAVVTSGGYTYGTNEFDLTMVEENIVSKYDFLRG